MRKPLKVLFVCIGNSCRSQMAEALARYWASDVIEPSSAGLSPLGEIAEATRSVLEERGVPLGGQYSKELLGEDCQAADLIINMTGQSGKKLFAGDAAKVEDWKVPDPYGEPIEAHREICAEIEARLFDLADRLRREQGGPGDS